MDKGSGSGIFPDPDPGDPKRPDLTGSGSATLLKTIEKKVVKNYKIMPSASFMFDLIFC